MLPSTAEVLERFTILNLLPDLSMSGEAPTWVLLPQVRQDLGASWLCVADVHGFQQEISA